MGIDGFYDFWRNVKLVMRANGELSASVVHIHFGLIGFFVFFALFRKLPRPEIKAWVCVFAFQLFNECVDVFFDLQRLGTVREWNSIEDFTATMFWPSVLVGFLFLLRGSGALTTTQSTLPGKD